MCNKFISWGILLFFLVNSLSAGIIRVPQDYTTIQEGIDAAETREDTIIVSPGTYFEHINFLGKEILLGSQFITTQDTMYISQTIIDGSSTGTVVTFNSLESALSKLSGFTIQNGYTSDDGGGVYIGTNATPMMDNLVIQNSIAEDKGGGVYSLGSPRMDFVKIMGNQAVQNGGGVYSETQMLIFRSVFSGNTATRGGAIYAYSSILGIYLTQIYENEASLEGGGIASMYSSVLTIASSSIIHNDATYGGGLFTEYSATTNIDNTIFYLNTPDQLKLTNQSIVNIQYSDCEGGESTISITGEAVLNWNTGNFDLDPIFQSIDPMDLNLSWNSPCIDSGDPDPDDNGSSWESDIGDQDPDGTRMDLGPLYFDQVNRTSFEVIGTLSINRTLMVDTIKVIGDITIDTAVTLSIQSGVLIEFQDQYKINVNGSILAIGTSSEKIRFDESNLGNRWNGLRYQSTPMTSDTSKFIYCEFLNGIGADPDHWGGSIFAQDFGKIYVSHCLFENNTVPFAGGAIMLDDAGITIEDSEFRNNHSSVQGGAFWAQNSNIILRRNVFYNNQADSSGGALHLLDISNATVQNVTFVGNEAFYGGAIIIGNSEIEFGNNIFWNNSSINGQIYSSTPNVSFTYCDIEGGLGAIMGSAPGTFQNNIDSDPLFINQSEGNLYLTAVSPCIDSGDPDLDGDGTSWETDPDDQDPDGTRMDMGAYYFHHVEDDSASNKIILFGKGIENAAFTYDVITDNWVELVSFPDPAADLYDNAMAYDAEGDKIILFGRGPDNAAYNYDATTDTWIEITSFPDPTADLHDNAMVYDTESDIIILFSLGTDNVAYSYDAQSDTWIDLIFPNPAADLQDNAMAYDLESDKIILFGRGADNVVYSYDVNTDTWVELSSFPDPTGDYYDNAMAYDTESDKMILFCRGSDNAAYSYDVNTDTWVELSSFPDPTGDYQDNAMAYDYESDRIILFCRGPDNVSYSYDTNSDTWVELSSFPDPTGDYYDNAMAYSGEIVQRYSGPTWHVSTYGSDETGDGSSTSPFASIQHGINSSINGDTVLVQPGTYIENINYDGKYIVVSSLELTSGDTSYISSTIIDGNQVARVVTFNSGEDSTTVLNGFTIYNGYNSSITNPDFKGGGIYCQNASPTFSNLRVFGNTALYGGGIYLDASNSRILDVAIVSNIGSYDGGGLYLNNCSDIYLENVTITQNIASGDGGNGYGGGIKCWQSGGLFSNLSVNDNEALQFGGGIYFDDTSPNMTSVSISGNTAANGGGLYIFESNPNISNADIMDNLASSSGGGAYITASEVAFNNTNIISNNSAGDGGAISAQNSNLLMDSCLVELNSTITGNGLGAFLSNTTGIVKHSTFSSNQVTETGYGGALYLTISSPTLEDNIFINNIAGEGGAICLDNSSPIVMNNVFAYNSCEGWGGAIKMNGGSSPQITNNTIFANTAGTSGGGIYASYANNTITNNIIFGNESLDMVGHQVALFYSNATNFFYNDIEGGLAQISSNVGFSGLYDGNIDLDPMFMSSVDNDFYLQNASPCIDSGHPDLNGDGDIWDIDPDDQDPDGTRMDMGAYYLDQTNFSPQISISPDSLGFTLNIDEEFEQSQALTISNFGLAPLEVEITINSDTIVTDIDGNIYPTVQIGDQVWMAENLKVTHYRNGTSITNVTDDNTWGELTTEAYCIYNNNASDEVDTYGALYNWYAVTDAYNIAPEGWHVPTDAEWKELEMALGMSQSEADAEFWRGTNEGSKLAGITELWNDGVLEDDSEFGSSGFTALPGGYRGYLGEYFADVGENAMFWSATESDNYIARWRKLDKAFSTIYRDVFPKRNGYSVRCIRDLPATAVEMPHEKNDRTLVGNLVIQDAVERIEESQRETRESWITTTPTELTIPPGESADVTVTVSAEGMDLGDYSDMITIISNDSTNSTIEVPVSMSVIFQDITPPTVELDTPDTLSIGEVTQLTWQAEDNSGFRSHHLFFSSETGQEFAFVDSVDGSSATYAWTVPNVISETARLSILSYDLVGLTGTDTTDIFVIIDEIELPLYGIWHVAVTGSNETGDGSPEAPFATIQFGIVASQNGDTVLVHPGTYIENINFSEKDIIVTSLAITTGDTSYISGTIIDGDQNGSVVTITGGESEFAQLYGFTIQNGGGWSTRGGGIYCSYSSPILDHLVIKNNRMPDESWTRGGGIYCQVASPLILNSIIHDNSSNGWGGGFFCEDYSVPIISNTVIYDNVAEWSGGGVVCGNYSELTMINVTISGNTATDNGGAVECMYHSELNIVNSILWNNEPQEILLSAESAVANITHSAILGGLDSIVNIDNGVVNWLSGNLSLNPSFVNPASSNYQLSDDSPCIGSGIDSVQIGEAWYYVPATDLDGNPRPRPFGTTPDMGAFENQTAINRSLWIVSTDGSDDDGDGSEESPFATIQFGIDASQTNDTVLVLPGTYVENINYNGKNVVLGSLTLISGDTSYISQTIIDGNESGSVVTFNSSEDTTSILNGFTVRNGSALAGGGVYCDASSPRLINLKISGNSASTFGGGIYSDHNGHPVVEGCEIVNNTAGVGGGIQCQNNSGITLNDVKVDSNQVTEYGGGIHMTWGVLSATNTSFNGNIVTHEINGLGGGIYLDGDGDYSFLNCAIQGNNVQYGGGGIYCNGSSPSLTNVLITNNIVESTDGAGSGIYGGLGSSSVLTNVTIANNWAPNSGAIIGFIEAVFINSIIWHNSPSTISNVTASFCNIEDRTPGVGNLNTDPLFVDMYNQDYHLSNSSPCIGTGIVEGAPAVDLDGNIRPDPPGSVPDMGAYENPLFERISGNIYFTSTTGSDSSFGGLTDPFLTVGRGIEATWNGDTLIVYPGLYGENISINAMSIVLASQLLTTADTSYVSSTIIDGNVSFDGDVDSTALFTGFTIQNGSIGISCLGDPVLSHLNIRGHTNVGISFSESDVSILHSVLNGNGRGIVAIGSELSLYNVDIKNNITSQRGAGIYLSGSTITMDSVEITDNLTTNGQGGGIYITSSTLVMTQSAVVGNTSENSNGGGIFITNGSSINLDNVTVSNNQADELGGGLFVGIDLNSSLIATNTSINNNVCNDYGGGIYIRGVDDFVLSQSRVQGNTVNRRGGGIYIRDAHPILTNVLISDNEVTGTEPDDGGGGIYLIDSNADPILTNVTIANNIANAGGGIYRYDLDCEPTFTNSIVWNNTPDSYNTSNGSMITYSNIEGGVPGGGNINIDPLFVDTLAGDYNLLENSPCIDTGDPDLDEDGDTWEMDPDDQDPDETRMDMGAFYYHQYYTGPVWHVSMEGSDDTGDGSVDNPFASIQHGINLANDLDTILVRPGTFNENIDYISKRLVIGSLFLTTQDTAYISQTVINGNGNDVVIIEEVDFTILSGFTLINGNAGVKIRNSNPSLNNLVIYDMSGAVPIGVRIEYDATVQLTDTEIFNNRIGILVLSTGELIGENLLIHDNTNEFDGGAGLYVNSNAGSDIPAIASLTRSVLFGNAGTNSGAIQNEGQLWLDNVTISQNTGTNADASGGIWQATMLDNIPEPGQEAVLHMRNTIIFDNIPAENYAIQDNNDFRPTCWDLDYNNIEINTFPDHCDYDIGENNQYNIDPVFSDEGSNDFYLLANSPCIDSGDPDLDGDTDTWETDPDDQDPDGTRMDMGAYYYHQLPAYEGPVWHISTEGSDETGNGSEDAPFASIQFGIDASQSNDTVLVLPGTYVETINYNGKNVVLGSLTLITGDTSYISQTIIDGDQASSVVTFGSAEDSTAVLLGFTIRNGRALNGGGIICYNTSPQIVSCRISGNTATSFGGGLCFDVNSKARIENCLIDSNDATLGGGVFCEINSDIKITDVIIRGNVATNLGGGFYCTEANPTFERVLVEGNIANAYGGVYFHGTESIETFLNKVTIVDNVAVTGGGLNSSHANTILTVNNCIIWGNSPDQVYEELGSLTINYSDVQNGWTGEGNIDEDPLFVNAADSDYRLQSDSPCIDTGNPTSPLDPDDTRADMGAYYFHQSIEEYDVPEPIWIDIINSTDSYSYQPSDAIQTSDRGLLVLGSIYDDSGTTDTDIFVKKYHPMGEINWTWQYYGPEQDRPVAFVEADSGNLFILSTTYITGENNFDFRLIKLDSDGNNIWNISYGASENEQGCDLVSVDDGVVVLYEYSSTINLSDLMVKKVDSDGNEVWERTHSGPGMNWGYSIIRTSDGGFAVLSNSSSNGAGGERPYFLKLDSSGYEEWSESYGVEDSSFVLDLIQLEENYILSGKIYDATQTGSKGWLLKIGEEGDVLWDRKYRLGEHIEFHSIDKCDDDGFLITGFGADELFDTLYTPLLKTTSEGNLEWVTTELFDQNNWGARAIQTADNGYFAIGWIHPDPTDVNVWAIRFEGELDVLPPQVSLQTSADLEQVVNGELVMIRWMAVDNFGLNWAKLFFTSDGGATFTFLDSVDANLSELEWVAPDIISNDCKFAIWVSDLAGNISADTLIGSFSINDGTLPLISIVNPTQTTTVREHDTLFVSWEASDNIGIEWFELWYSNNPSEPFENLVQISFDDTSFAFGIGDGVSDSARIKMDVMDVAGNTAEDISEYFSVTDNTSPVISFFSIPDTVEWGIGSIMDISVVASDNVEVTGLDLNYTIDAGATWIPIVQDLYPVEGRPTYSWLIPDAPGNCQIKAIVRDAVGLTDIAYSDIFSIIIEYPRLIANLAQITPLGTINVRFSQLMDSLDISAGTQVIGTIAGSYDIEGSVSGEDVSISTPQGFVSLDTLMIVFFAQDWTNRLGYGLDGNGNGSFEGSPVDNDTVLVHITPAGDYNQDYIFNFDDFSDFVLAWHADYFPYELAPNTYEIPYISIQPDSIFNIFDLATFASMWNWSVGIEQVPPVIDGFHLVSLEAIQEGNQLTVVLDKEEYLATQTIIKYDPSIVAIDIQNQGLAKVSASSMVFVDTNPDSGYILITSSQLTESNDMLLQLQLSPSTRQKYSIEVAVQGTQEDGNVTQKRTSIDLIPIPTTYSLSQNYPNPFNASTTIEYGLPKDSDMSISIYDIRGRFVRDIYSGEKQAGYHVTQWNGLNDGGHGVSSGLYFIVLSTPDYRIAKKALILK